MFYLKTFFFQLIVFCFWQATKLLICFHLGGSCLGLQIKYFGNHSILLHVSLIL